MSLTPELLTLNFGPHHPATHGVLRLMATLDGEIVRDVKPEIGYLHTGIEKTAEDMAYWKVIPIVERMDYLAYYFNAMAFCGAVETILDLEVPPRAQYLRVINMELNRITSTSCGWARARWISGRSRCSGIASATASRSSTCSRCPRASACTRATSRSAASSRTSRSAGCRRSASSTAGMPARVDQFEALLDKNEIFLHRLRDVGGVDEETLLGLGVTGPLLRATGNLVGPAQGRAVLLLRALRVQDPGRHGRRQLRPLPRTHGRHEGVGQDHRPGARRPARGSVHHAEPRVRAAATPRAGDEHGGADPPLQARHRGLPRAAGRGLLPDRVPARRDGLLRARGPLVQARARAHARPPFVNLQALRPMVRNTTSPTSSRRWACWTRSSVGSTADYRQRQLANLLAEGERGWKKSRSSSTQEVSKMVVMFDARRLKPGAWDQFRRPRRIRVNTSHPASSAPIERNTPRRGRGHLWGMFDMTLDDYHRWRGEADAEEEPSAWITCRPSWRTSTPRASMR